MWINAYFQLKSVLMVTLDKGSFVYKNELPFRGDQLPFRGDRFFLKNFVFFKNQSSFDTFY